MQQSDHVRRPSAPAWELPTQAKQPSAPPEKPRRQKKLKITTPHKRILSYLLCFALGILLALAVVAIVMASLLGGSARNALAALGIDAEGILTEEYLDRPALEVMDEVLADLKTLSDPDSVGVSSLGAQPLSSRASPSSAIYRFFISVSPFPLWEPLHTISACSRLLLFHLFEKSKKTARQTDRLFSLTKTVFGSEILWVHAHWKGTSPAPSSKWYLTMPRSTLL